MQLRCCLLTPLLCFCQTTHYISAVMPVVQNLWSDLPDKKLIVVRILCCRSVRSGRGWAILKSRDCSLHHVVRQKKEAACFPETSVPPKRICGAMTKMNKIWILPRWKPQISQLGIRLQRAGLCNGSEDWHQQRCVTYLINSAHITYLCNGLINIRHMGKRIQQNSLNLMGSLHHFWHNNFQHFFTLVFVLHVYFKICSDSYCRHSPKKKKKKSELIVVLKESVLLRSSSKLLHAPVADTFIEFCAPTQLSAQEQKTRKTLKLT